MDWHKRFRQQAGWTAELRGYLFSRAGLPKARRVLEVGCGTGAILEGLGAVPCLHGLDLDFHRLRECGRHAPFANPACGDGQALPYPAGTFDLTFCHYLLLWVRNPRQVLLEMKRVTRAGGAVLALAEPDYTQRRDEPEIFAELGAWQNQALSRQGAALDMGSLLAGLFDKAGMPPVEAGVLAGGFQPGSISWQEWQEWQGEWDVLQHDLQGSIAQDRLEEMKQMDKKAWQQGLRRLHIPTHYAWGRA
jgi:SAM-dependent methyltransferase